MKRQICLVAAMGLLAGFFVSGSKAHEKGYAYTIPQSSVPPAIDGNLNDAIWSAAKPVVWGNINEGGTVPKEQNSESWAAYDANNLYIAFRNLTPNPGDMVAVSPGHDSDVWKDEENEIFIEPGHLGAAPYYHIMINFKNVVQDDGLAGAAWDPPMKSAAKTGAKDWTVEISIAWKDLDQKAAPVGKTWGWNFNRHIVTKKPEDIWTGWATTGASFHTPARFGDLTFGAQVLAVDPAGKTTSTWASLKNR